MLRALVLAALMAVAGLALTAPASAEAGAPPNCVGADWRAIGFRDGAERGSTVEGSSHVAERRESCGENFDEHAYEGGFIDGLRVFCEPAHGFAMARAGQSYTGLCHSDQAEAFARALAEGRRATLVTTALTRATERKDALFEQRREVNETLREVESFMGNVASGGGFGFGVSGRPDPMSRERRMAELRAQRAAIEDALHETQVAIPRLEQELAALRAETSTQYGDW